MQVICGWNNFTEQASFQLHDIYIIPNNFFHSSEKQENVQIFSILCKSFFLFESKIRGKIKKIQMNELDFIQFICILSCVFLRSPGIFSAMKAEHYTH